MRYDTLQLILIVSFLSFTGCKAQKPFGENYLQVNKIIPLPNVKGRIDHLDINLREQVMYVAALANNSVEVVDLKNGKVIHSIRGLDEPQGVCYIPQNHEIFITNGGNGACYFFNASSFEKTAEVHLSSDADNARYDSAGRKIFVGYGEGGIAVIDVSTHKQTNDVKLPSHPEGLQFDYTLNRILVNVPGKNMIGLIDLKQFKLGIKWSLHFQTGNFPIAVDVLHHYAFTGCRHPAKLVVVNTKNGEEVSTHDIVNDVDDLYFDAEKGRIYVSGGGGFVNIFQQDTAFDLRQIANIPAGNGARTSLFVPQLKIFVLAQPSSPGNTAQLIIYNLSR